MTDILTFITDFMIITSLIPIGLFIFRYGKYSPGFIKYPEGRMVMLQKICFFLLITLISIRTFIPGFEGLALDVLRAMIYGTLYCVFWGMTVNLIKLQREGKKIRDEQVIKTEIKDSIDGN